MKSFWIFLFLCISGVCMGQFHTLRPTRDIIAIEVAKDSSTTLGRQEKEPTTKQTPSLGSSQLTEKDSLHEVYVRQLASVALPLSSLAVSSKYGLRRDPFDHAKISQHNGLDLKASPGTNVYAMFAGKVIRISSDGRSGNYVSLQHGDYVISYCHLTSALVKVGDFVQPGDLVALTGNTGRSTGPHLHITVRRKGKHVNPVILLEYIIEVRTHALEGLNKLLS